MSDLLVSVASALMVVGLAIAFSRGRIRSSSRRTLKRLKVEKIGQVRSERRALLAGLADRVSKTRLGAWLEIRGRKVHPTRPFSDVLAIYLIGSLGAAIFSAVLFGVGPLMVLCILAGPVVAEIVARRVDGKSAQRFEQLLPKVLEMQAAALRAGHSLADSLRIAVVETKEGQVQQMLESTMRSLELGVPIGVALESLIAVAPTEAIPWITAMLVHRQTGGNLASVLDAVAGRLRERARLRGEVRALTAQARLSGLVVSLAPIGFLTIMFLSAREEMRSVFTSTSGTALLGAGLGLQALGLLWIRSIMRVKF